MRVIVVGGTGTIGSAVASALSARHDVVTAGRYHGAVRLDMVQPDAIRDMFRAVGHFDALVSAAGQAKFGSLDELNDADYQFGFANKLMGQANLVRIGSEFVVDGGSFTLTSGVLSQEPMKGSASISIVNAGLEGFVRRGPRTAARDPRQRRQPAVGDRNLDQTDHGPVTRLAGFVRGPRVLRCVEGRMTGQTIDPRKRSAM